MPDTPSYHAATTSSSQGAGSCGLPVVSWERPEAGEAVGTTALGGEGFPGWEVVLALLSPHRPGPSSILDSWKSILVGVVVATLLLLLVVLSTVLGLRKARARVGKGEADSWPGCSGFSGRKEPSGADQQATPDEDPAAIHYVSLTHLSHCGSEHPVYANVHPDSKPEVDAQLSVEYTSVTGSKPPVLQVGCPGGSASELQAESPQH
nr:uncharacterized protein LOC103349828 [Oryctolagus cuniculus]